MVGLLDHFDFISQTKLRQIAKKFHKDFKISVSFHNRLNLLERARRKSAYCCRQNQTFISNSLANLKETVEKKFTMEF